MPQLMNQQCSRPCKRWIGRHMEGEKSEWEWITATDIAVIERKEMLQM